jgi:hypothetical protein
MPAGCLNRFKLASSKQRTKKCFSCARIANAATRTFHLNPSKLVSARLNAHSAQHVPRAPWSASARIVVESSSLVRAARHPGWPSSRHQRNASQSRSVARHLRELPGWRIWQQPERSLRGTQNVVLSLPIDMTPRARRILQAVLYDVGAIALAGPVLGFAFEKPISSTFLLASVLCNDPVKTCSGAMFGGHHREHVDGRGNQTLDGAA